jgi:hypothetical protein
MTAYLDINQHIRQNKSRLPLPGMKLEDTIIESINIDGSVKSPNFDGFVKSSRSRLANPEE